MSENHRFPTFSGKREATTHRQTTPLKQELDEAVALHQFERERMGLAAKE